MKYLIATLFLVSTFAFAGVKEVIKGALPISRAECTVNKFGVPTPGGKHKADCILATRQLIIITMDSKGNPAAVFLMDTRTSKVTRLWVAGLRI